MLKDLKRRLFPHKYLLRENARQLARIEGKMAEYQGILDYVIATSPLKSHEIKDLAYFFHLKRGEAKAQLFQDLWVLWEMKGKTGGFFVEFGAADGMDLSNTYLLEEKYGWKGILSEPMPDWHPQLKRRTAIVDTRCVWSVSGEKLPFLCSNIPELSGLKETASGDGHSGKRRNARQVEVETVSLYDLLKEHHAPQVIDYLSVDTEGSEYEILSHFDFASFQIKLITVEHNYSESRQKIHDLLSRNGYLRVFEEFSSCDDWYVHKSLRAPQAAS
jgi:FkbM family methyltransferase